MTAQTSLERRANERPYESIVKEKISRETEKKWEKDHKKLQHEEKEKEIDVISFVSWHVKVSTLCLDVRMQVFNINHRSSQQQTNK